MSSFASRTVLALATLSLPGCLLDWNSLRRDASAPADITVVPDATPEMDVVSPPEAGPEPTREAGPEAGPEAGLEAGMDAGAEAGMDAGREASVDAAMEAGRDATPDTSPPSDADPGCTGPVVVNEVQHTGSSGSDEFVELHNAGTCEVNLDGWRVVYLTGTATTGATPQELFVFGPTDRLLPNTQLLIAGAMFMPAATLRRVLAGRGISSAAGVAVFDRSGRRMDSVAFGTVSATHPFGEPDGTMPAMSSGTSTSLARVPNGRDTNNNAADFRVGPPSPGMPNP